MPRSISNCLAVLSVFASSLALGQATTTISSSEIVLPSAGEFELVTRDSPEVHPILVRLAQECDGKNCGMYVGEADSTELLTRTWETLPPFFLLEVLDDELAVQSDQFPRIMQILRADAEGFRANAESGLSELPFDVDIVAPDGSDLFFVNATAEASEEFYQSEICLAIPVSGTINYKHKDGSTVGYRLNMMLGFVLVKDKIVVTSLIARGKEMPWIAHSFEKFIEVLADENR